jgi:DNA mismatch repair protein MutS
MTFESILFAEPHEPIEADAQPPLFFQDLNLDQLIARITKNQEEYDLAPFFYSPLRDLATVLYRQEIARDLENKAVMGAIRLFAEKMRAMRAAIAQSEKLHYYKLAMQRRFLDAANTYAGAVDGIRQDLHSLAPASRGLRTFRDYLDEYTASTQFRECANQARSLVSDLSEIRYAVLIKDGNVTVRKYEGEADYSVAIEKTFEKFRRDSKQQHSLELQRWEGMNHIEAQIQDRLALLYPDVFRRLEEFYNAHQDFSEKTIVRFDREVQFYVAYLVFADSLRAAGLSFCEPRVSATSKEISGYGCFDAALAAKLLDEHKKVVTNDFYLRHPERIFVVSGPNQGGKTTFARMLGQIHYLASLGCIVPGTEVRAFLFDQLFTHFERSEQAANLRGKLQDDLLRIHAILEQATPNSILIINEIFSSTTLKDALFLSKKILQQISDRDLLAVCVTFLDELASLNQKTVSIVSLVDPADPALRTYKLERRPANGLAYALAIAEKHQVTYEFLRQRIKP